MAWYAAQRVIWLLIGAVGAFGWRVKGVWLRRNLLRLFSGCLWDLRQPEKVGLELFRLEAGLCEALACVDVDGGELFAP